MVGEDHKKSDANAEKERRYIRSVLGTPYKFWYEDQFTEGGIKLPIFQARQHGDPYSLRALTHFADLRERCYSFVQGVNADPGPSVSKLSMMLDSMPRKIRFTILNLERGKLRLRNARFILKLKLLRRRIRRDMATLNQYLNIETESDRRCAAEADLQVMHAFYLHKCNQFNDIVLQQNRRTDFTLSKKKESVPYFLYDSAYDEDISVARSMAMHDMANRYHTRVGVWKIGDRHAQHIEDRANHGGDPALDYNLLRRDEFTALVSAHSTATAKANSSPNPTSTPPPNP